MHLSGKIAAIFVVIAAMVAAAYTAKLIQVRNSWTAKANASKTKFAELEPKIEALQTRIDSLKSEIFRSRELWGNAWSNIPTNIANRADGTITVGIGTKFGVRPAMLLHGFEVAPDGSSIYRGSFLVAEVQDESASLKPNFRATPDEIQKWQAGNWRWRNTVPTGYQDTFDQQLLAILKDEETLRARSGTLEGQKELLIKANSNLKQREAELVGGEGLSKETSVDPEFREGLVVAVEQTEEERNQVLQKVDELRRAVRNVQADIEQLQSENAELIQKLPEPAPRDTVTQKR